MPNIDTNIPPDVTYSQRPGAKRDLTFYQQKVNEALPSLEAIDFDKSIMEDPLYLTSYKYTPDERLRACAYYQVLGNFRKVGALTGILPGTIGEWSKTPWWKSLSAVIRKHRQDELDAKLTTIIHSAADQLDDRITNGNITIDPETGEQKRKPLTAVELATSGL